MAESVMHAPGSGLAQRACHSSPHTTTDAVIKRKCAVGASCDPPRANSDWDAHRKQAPSSQRVQDGPPSLEPRIASLRGRGEPLPLRSRKFFESRFGADFRDVRIHRSGTAQAAAHSIQARAFTTGNDIVFGKGEYDPQTSHGGLLIAHELAHTLQQSGGRNSSSPAARLSAEQIQRSPIVSHCDPAQTGEISDAASQAETDLADAISWLENAPDSGFVQDAMWLTFRDTDPLKLTAVREILTKTRDAFPHVPIHCEQEADYSSECSDGAEAYHARGGVFNTYLCMGKWRIRTKDERARTLIHEAVHNLAIIGDAGYFSRSCEKTAETATLSPGALYLNADSYACLTRLLTHETPERLRSRVEYEKREYQGATLEGIVQSPPGSIDLNSGYEYLPRFRVRFEGDVEAPHESKIPGALFRWTIVAGNGNEHPLSEPGEQGQFSPHFETIISSAVREELKSGPLGTATILCEVMIPGAATGPFTLRSPIELIARQPGTTEIGTVPFDTGSAEPDDLAMLELVRRVMAQGILTGSGNYHLTFEGRASRAGNEAENLDLSRQRAQTAKDTLESWLQMAGSDATFQFLPDQFTLTASGEERARVSGKTEDDDSAEDRVVSVTLTTN